MITTADIEAAAGRLEGVVVRTPLIRHAELDRVAGSPVLIKPECFQAIGSFKIRVAASKTPLKPPKKSRSHFASTEVSSTMSAATGVSSTGLETNESGDTVIDTEMIHADADVDAAYLEDGSLDDVDEGASRDVPNDRSESDSDEIDVMDAGASPPNGSETTTTTTTDSPISVSRETNDEREATTKQMGKLTVCGGAAEVIPLIDETEFPPLGR